MSYFLCLSLPEDATSRLRNAFDQRISLAEASGFPIGQAVRGKNKNWASYLLQVGFDSHTLVAVGVKKKTHNNDHTQLLVSGIQVLLEDEDCPSVSLLLHLMHGYISTEEVSVRHQNTVKLSEIAEMIAMIEEDVIYSILR